MLNNKKIIIGLSLVIVILLGFLTVFYFIDKENKNYEFKSFSIMGQKVELKKGVYHYTINTDKLEYKNACDTPACGCTGVYSYELYDEKSGVEVYGLISFKEGSLHGDIDIFFETENRKVIYNFDIESSTPIVYGTNCKPTN